jgi:redox-sensitive bicupin YhaK (pirin superfamily)
MITVRRNSERQYDRRRKQEGWRTFDAQERSDPLADGFGTMEILNEALLAPSASVGHPHHDAEIVTYVREGALAYEDSMGRSGVIHGGEFHHMTAGRGIRHTETNASGVDSAHVFQIWVRPSETGLASSHQQKRFSAADRRGVLCLVASPNAHRGSLRIHQDALMYSAMLDRGQHVVHELTQGRMAWLHLVHGQATLGDIILSKGDGAGIVSQRAVSFTAQEATEVLLFDLAGPPLSAPGPAADGDRPKGANVWPSRTPAPWHDGISRNLVTRP